MGGSYQVFGGLQNLNQLGYSQTLESCRPSQCWAWQLFCKALYVCVPISVACGLSILAEVWLWLILESQLSLTKISICVLHWWFLQILCDWNSCPYMESNMWPSHVHIWERGMCSSPAPAMFTHTHQPQCQHMYFVVHLSGYACLDNIIMGVSNLCVLVYVHVWLLCWWGI